MRSKWILVAALAAAGVTSGCASYYKVTNPSTGDVYYTDNLDRHNSGMVQFKDPKTGQQVTLGASEVQQITKEEYNVGRYSPTPTPLQNSGPAQQSASQAQSPSQAQGTGTAQGTGAAQGAGAVPTTNPSSGQ